ncbi:hypothetical protein [Kitasatospora sp. NPDC058046]|uniref:hypothetical protein n=1 Tax=Kitasatospora sp. NPDC058046 TaxID=3346312 RepID=UPI0036DF4938
MSIAPEIPAPAALEQWLGRRVRSLTVHAADRAALVLTCSDGSTGLRTAVDLIEAWCPWDLQVVLDPDEKPLSVWDCGGTAADDFGDLKERILGDAVEAVTTGRLPAEGRITPQILHRVVHELENGWPSPSLSALRVGPDHSSVTVRPAPLVELAMRSVVWDLVDRMQRADPVGSAAWLRELLGLPTSVFRRDVPFPDAFLLEQFLGLWALPVEVHSLPDTDAVLKVVYTGVDGESRAHKNLCTVWTLIRNSTVPWAMTVAAADADGQILDRDPPRFPRPGEERGPGLSGVIDPGPFDHLMVRAAAPDPQNRRVIEGRDLLEEERLADLIADTVLVDLQTSPRPQPAMDHDGRDLLRTGARAYTPVIRWTVGGLRFLEGAGREGRDALLGVIRLARHGTALPPVLVQLARSAGLVRIDGTMDRVVAEVVRATAEGQSAMPELVDPITGSPWTGI